jgi:hypothetical protein
MRKKANAGDGKGKKRDGKDSKRVSSRGTSQKTRKTRKARTRRTSRTSQKTSAGEMSDGDFGTGGGVKARNNPAPNAQTEPPGNNGGSTSTSPPPVDRRALRRILTWLLETNTEQQSLILSAMDIVSDAQTGSARPADPSTSPGAMLRALLAERTAARLNPTTPSIKGK